MMVPVFQALKALYLKLVHAPPPPSNLPPMPPPPPLSPDLVTVISEATFTFAKEQPTLYLLIDLFFLLFFGTLFLFMKDITDFIERTKMEAAQAENQKSRYTELEAEAKKEADLEAAQRDGEPLSHRLLEADHRRLVPMMHELLTRASTTKRKQETHWHPCRTPMMKRRRSWMPRRWESKIRRKALAP